MRDTKNMSDFLLGELGGSAGSYPPPPHDNHSCRGPLPLLAGAGLALLVVAGRRLRRLEVEGDSMRPTLLPGDRVLVWRGRRLRSGDVVALVDPKGRRVVKRLSEGTGTGYFVIGDNLASSTDSRHFGPVEPSAILGRVVWRYWPEDRRGRIPLSASAAHALSVQVARLVRGG
jgi:nickel-type superoxide dismutase maturation protease